MFDYMKDYLSPRTFSIFAYLCVIIHVHVGVIFTAITTALRLGEMENFSCAVDTNYQPTKTYVEKECFAMYDEIYNSPVRFSSFVPINFGSLILVSIVYCFLVTSRVDEIEKFLHESKQSKTLAQKQNKKQDRKSFYVFNLYLGHLFSRFVLGIIFITLQQTLYPSGFETELSCVYQTLPHADQSTTAARNVSVYPSNVTCKHFTASGKQNSGTVLFVYNVILAILALEEVFYLILHRSFHSWSCDLEFVVVYFLQQQYDREKSRLIKVVVDDSTLTKSELYKKKVLEISRTPDINYGPNTSLDEMFINVVIQTGQAPHKFSKNMDRYEIYDVYMKVPKESIRLENIKDLFYPNKDTRGNFPRTILALGRPGIGKTVLSRKIMRDWAKHKDHDTKPGNGNRTKDFFQDKTVFFYKFREFKFQQFQNVTLETFLYFGTVGLSEKEFQSIYEEIGSGSKEAVFIFDGLDEISGNFENYLDQSKLFANDITTPMPPVVLLIKLVSRRFDDFLQGSTIMVTSRPSVYDIYSKLSFNRTVEILGFTSDKIKEYVGLFCENVNKTYPHHKTSVEKNESGLNKNTTDDVEEVDETRAKISDDKKSDLKRKMWAHISSSSQVRHCCYIPVNCFIVCVTLLQRLIDPSNDAGALPTTLTELYQAAVFYFNKHHGRKEKTEYREKVLKDLQQLAFCGMENDQQLVFDDELVSEQMKESGLLHCLPSSFFQIQTQVCFIHLTVQEFLAAKHIVETKTPEEIKQFIASHFREGKWHLVLQFLAGLLGRKIKISSQYRCCASSFTEHFRVETNGDDVACKLLSDTVLGMKCVSEMENDGIAAETATTSALKAVTKLCTSRGCTLSTSDWTAVVLVCKHLKILNSFCFRRLNLGCLVEGTKLLQGRCVKALMLDWAGFDDLGLQNVLDALKGECHLDHEHSELTTLRLYENKITDVGLLQLCQYLNFHGSGLKELRIGANKITSNGMSAFSNVLTNGVCSGLEVLDLSNNGIGNDGACFLLQALIENQCKLRTLDLGGCCLTSECISLLTKVLSCEHCEITKLSLSSNEIGDTGVRILCEAFQTKHCKLAHLDLYSCKLTDKCMPFLREALEDGRCSLTKLGISGNDIGDCGVRMLCEALKTEQCKLAELRLDKCSLTDGCMLCLCQALGDKHCKLTRLHVSRNKFTDTHLPLLSDVLKLQHCSLRYLGVHYMFSKEGKELLRHTIEYELCKDRGLNIRL